MSFDSSPSSSSSSSARVEPGLPTTVSEANATSLRYRYEQSDAPSGIEKGIPIWIDSEFGADLMNVSLERQREIVAHRGDASANLVKNIQELNNASRSHYAKFIVDVGMHLRPVIIASDYEADFKGVGGTFKLFLADGSVEQVTPAPPRYQIQKSACHLVLGLSAILLPYLNCQDGYGWGTKAKALQVQIESIRLQMSTSWHNEPSGAVRAEQDVWKRVEHMLAATSHYISLISCSSSIGMEDFQAYTKKMLPMILESMSDAGRAQVEADMPVLLKWKKRLGADWSKVYVIIPTVWPVAGDNPRERMFSLLLPNPAMQIVKVQNQTLEADLFATLGRVIGDRAISSLVFGSETPEARDAQLSLSTPRDLVSSSCADALLNYIRTCDQSDIDCMLDNDSATATNSDHDIVDAINRYRKDDADAGSLRNELAHQLFYTSPMNIKQFADALLCHDVAAASSSTTPSHGPVLGGQSRCPMHFVAKK